MALNLQTWAFPQKEQMYYGKKNLVLLDSLSRDAHTAYLVSRYTIKTGRLLKLALVFKLSFQDAYWASYE